MANNDFFGVYDHFKFNYYFFNSSTEEAICDYTTTRNIRELQHKVKVTIDKMIVPQQ